MKKKIILSLIIITAIIFLKTYIKHTYAASSNCVVSAILVNPCRALLGTAATNYPPPYATGSDTKSQILGHESRIGRKLDIAHTYHPVNSNSLSSTDLYFINRANTYLLTNWKPVAKWRDANPNNSAATAGIDQMAKSVAAIAPKKIFIALHHEPENDASGGGTCSSYKGSFGTASEYKAMWIYVESEFKKLGATNVVWVMDYMNYPPWDCIVQQLYPGDQYVDWIMFNGYGSTKSTNWQANVDHFYSDVLTKNSNSQHNYLSKPWGIVEFGLHNTPANIKTQYYKDMKTTLDNGRYKNLKAYIAYDSRSNGSATGADVRIAYDDKGNYVQSLQDTYNNFANDPLLSGSSATTATNTTFNLDLLIHGIGKAGDNQNPGLTGGGNQSPNHTSRTVTVVVSKTTGTILLTKTGTVTYDPTSGSFTGNIDMGNLATGTYEISVKAPQTLQAVKTVDINQGTTNQIPQMSLVTGDINNDNTISSILDYNLLLDCYSDLNPAPNCSDQNKKDSTDLNDDGSVDLTDLNLFLREITNIHSP